MQAESKPAMEHVIKHTLTAILAIGHTKAFLIKTKNTINSQITNKDSFNSNLSKHDMLLIDEAICMIWFSSNLI